MDKSALLHKRFGGTPYEGGGSPSEIESAALDAALKAAIVAAGAAYSLVLEECGDQARYLIKVGNKFPVGYDRWGYMDEYGEALENNTPIYETLVYLIGAEKADNLVNGA